MSGEEWIVNHDWMREYQRNVEGLIGKRLEYDGNENPVPPIPIRNSVVRCRDCYQSFDNFGQLLCRMPPECMEVTPDGFCAWGERRDA